MKHNLPFHTWKHNPSVNEITIDQILKIKPKSIYDVGAGDGFYGKLLKYLLDYDAQTCGIEKNHIYIDQFGLKSIYDVVIIKDIVDIISKISGDLIIFGDVLEHLEKEGMINVLRTSVKNFKYIIINSPLGFQPQDHVYPEEIHRCGIEESDFKDYEVLDFKVYDEIMFHCLVKGKE